MALVLLKPEHRLMYGLSFVLRILGGYLGGVVAQVCRGAGQPFLPNWLGVHMIRGVNLSPFPWLIRDRALAFYTDCTSGSACSPISRSTTRSVGWNSVFQAPTRGSCCFNSAMLQPGGQLNIAFWS